MGTASTVGPASPVGRTRQKVFRLVLEDGQCELESAEWVEGDFKVPRGNPAIHPGMLACRMLGADGDLISEKLVHPPDHVCAVIDPLLDPDNPRVTLLAGLGPQVFQVRFPESDDARQLEVRRITRIHPEISETLLLTVPIQP